MDNPSKEPEEYWWVDADDVRKLREISAGLHMGTDRERDYGHRLWLVLDNLIAPTRVTKE